MGNENSYTLASSSLGVDFISRALDPGSRRQAMPLYLLLLRGLSQD